MGAAKSANVREKETRQDASAAAGALENRETVKRRKSRNVACGRLG